MDDQALSGLNQQIPPQPQFQAPRGPPQHFQISSPRTPSGPERKTAEEIPSGADFVPYDDPRFPNSVAYHYHEGQIFDEESWESNGCPGTPPLLQCANAGCGQWGGRRGFEIAAETETWRVHTLVQREHLTHAQFGIILFPGGAWCHTCKRWICKLCRYQHPCFEPGAGGWRLHVTPYR